MSKLRVAVVGAGIHGLSAARNLAERGHSVTVYDPWPIGHERGSSHGRSRIVRKAYPDPYYTKCMEEGYPLWHELERASGQQLIHEVGLLYFGSSSSPDLASMTDGLREVGVPHEVLSGRAVASVFPRLNLERNETGVFTPEAGWVDALGAITATRRLAHKAGCQWEYRNFLARDCAKYERIVACPGPWVRYWWPDAPVNITLQTTAYVEAEIDGPVWIEDGANLLYGFPNDGVGFKIGVHREGPHINPNSWDRRPNEEFIRLIAEVATARFGIQDPKLFERKGCIYTKTRNENFILKQINDRTILASACSGHGFKFGPWIGLLLADFVEGRRSMKDYPRFFHG